MTTYRVDGINVTELIYGPGQTGAIDVSNGFKNFPTGYKDPSNNRFIAQCDNFGFTINNTDVGSLYKSVQIDVSNSTTINISNIPYRKFKHVSSLLYGGGGGGGGGGGQGWNGNSTSDGRPGAMGGWGGFSWIRKTPITQFQSLICNIGNGGTGGAGGNDSSKPLGQSRAGNDGGTGNNGGPTDLSGILIGSNSVLGIHTANGGTGGGGGAGGERGTITNPGIDGSNNIIDLSGVSQGGGTSRTDTLANLYRPINDGAPGNGGPENVAGNAGEKGYAWLWFTYEKN